MAKKERLRRDHAGIGPEPNRSGLQSLKRIKGFRIAKGEPDIRGWEVHTLNGRRVGEVDDLLVDVDAGDVVMMDVEMRGSQRHLELPIRSAQLDRDRRRVIVDSGDVERYGAGIDLDRDGREDRDELADRDRDYDRDRDRDGVDDRLERDRPLRGASRMEQDALSPETRADADETVVERRPVVEEVVIRRHVVDRDEPPR